LKKWRRDLKKLGEERSEVKGLVSGSVFAQKKGVESKSDENGDEFLVNNRMNDLRMKLNMLLIVIKGIC
jgi:hypothetical protein